MAGEHQRDTDKHRIEVHCPISRLVGMWDRSRLERAFGNILSNAVKFSPRGGAVTIRLEMEQGSGGTAVISIQDEGLGIPAGDLPRIFERGQRAANVAEIEGTGLGLTGALSAIQEHGGTISVSSTEGQGASFIIRLPMDISGASPPTSTGSRPPPGVGTNPDS
jgi:signal transduction histidine kinase